MQFRRLDLPGVFEIQGQPAADQRGQFVRIWCRGEFLSQGLTGEFVQASLAWTQRRGTLRGLHYQLPPHSETKLVRCVRGAAYVVVADLRPDSPSHTDWVSIELSAENRKAIYVPQGCAQGYQTLVDDTELLYQMSQYYEPSAARGVRYDDPALNIRWPLPAQRVSPRDRTWGDYSVAGLVDQDVGRASKSNRKV